MSSSRRGWIHHHGSALVSLCDNNRFIKWGEAAKGEGHRQKDACPHGYHGKSIILNIIHYVVRNIRQNASNHKQNWDLTGFRLFLHAYFKRTERNLASPWFLWSPGTVYRWWPRPRPRRQYRSHPHPPGRTLLTANRSSSSHPGFLRPPGLLRRTLHHPRHRWWRGAPADSEDQSPRCSPRLLRRPPSPETVRKGGPLCIHVNK